MCILIDYVQLKKEGTFCENSIIVMLFFWASGWMQHIAKLADSKHSVLPVPAYNFMRAHPHPANKLAMQVS